MACSDLDHALNAVSREDPSLKVSTDVDSGQVSITAWKVFTLYCGDVLVCRQFCLVWVNCTWM